MSTEYNADFFNNIGSYAQTTAKILYPILTDIYPFASVADIGCGDGEWLGVLAQQGIAEYAGLDGEWVKPEQLKIPRERFQQADLNKPFQLPRRYDLAMSLEVAEHLLPERAESFIADLVTVSDVVLFSAAIPGQGGTDHLNEQWPGYWARIFARHGYTAYDCLRPQLWLNKEVGWFYAQNILLFVRDSALESGLLPDLNREKLGKGGMPLPLVHPLVFYFHTADMGLSRRMKALPDDLNRALRKRFQGVVPAVPFPE